MGKRFRIVLLLFLLLLLGPSEITVEAGIVTSAALVLGGSKSTVAIATPSAVDGIVVSLRRIRVPRTCFF